MIPSKTVLSDFAKKVCRFLWLPDRQPGKGIVFCIETKESFCPRLLGKEEFVAAFGLFYIKRQDNSIYIVGMENKELFFIVTYVDIENKKEIGISYTTPMAKTLFS